MQPTKSRFLKLIVVLGLIVLVLVVGALAILGPTLPHFVETITVPMDGTISVTFAEDTPQLALQVSMEVFANGNRWTSILQPTADSSVYELTWSNLIGQHKSQSINLDYLLINGLPASERFQRSPENALRFEGTVCSPMEIQTLDSFADNNQVPINVRFNYIVPAWVGCIEGLRGGE